MLSAAWDEVEGLCMCITVPVYSLILVTITDVYFISGDVEIEHDGQVIHDRCNVLINGAGVVNKWKCKSQS